MFRKKKRYNVAVVGVGAVGEMMLRVLGERKFPLKNLRVLARSARTIRVDDVSYDVETISRDAFEGIDIALFAGTEGDKGAAVTYAPDAVRAGAIVIDNGGDFRMKPDVPLIVPEVNPRDVKKNCGIIANPNCSTIQMLVPLFPLHKVAKLKRIIVSTYQAASGAGQQAVDELKTQCRAILEEREPQAPQAMSRVLGFSLIPQIGGFGDDDMTSEEWKMVRETHKIFHTDRIQISATCVRVPVINGHSESVYVELQKEIDTAGIRAILKEAPGVVVHDDPDQGGYAVPSEVSGRDDVFVSRIRRDPSRENAFWMWIVADNLRKGAATNAVQIAETLAGLPRA